jgi:hypothetical protein
MAERLLNGIVLDAAETMSDPADLINRAIEALRAAATDLPGFSMHRPANSPPEADCNRHPRPVETATPGRRHRAVRRGKLPLTNNFYLVRREVVN